MLLDLDLQFFSNDEEEPNGDDYFDGGDFDMDKFQSDYEASLGEDDEEEKPNTETENEDTEDEISQESSEAAETEETPATDESEEPQFQTQKQNEAFANMRKQLKEEQKYSNFIKDLAEKQGMKPDQLMEAYQEKQLQQQAEEKGVPVDVLKRLNELETENKSAKQQAFAERFNREVESTKSKYNMNDQDIDSVLQFMGQNGYINEDNTSKISFEDGYVLANRDKLLSQAKEQGRQEYLESKKAKQESSTVVTGNAQSPEASSDDWSEEDVYKMLQKFDIPL